jgi:very-short-patch-repair endonuclease
MKGYDFDRQRPIDNFIVDFYCKDLMLAIEIDGSSHDSKEAYIRNVIKQQKLESFDIHFLRFDDREVKKDVINVLREIEGWIVDYEEKNLGKLVGRIHP